MTDFALDPLHLVFWVLRAFFVVGLLAMPLVPDVVTRAAGWFGSLRPQVGVPASARSTLVAVLPSLVAIWAVVACTSPLDHRSPWHYWVATAASPAAP